MQEVWEEQVLAPGRDNMRFSNFPSHIRHGPIRGLPTITSQYFQTQIMEVAGKKMGGKGLLG